MTAMYGIWHSPEGLKQIANRIRFRTEVLRDEFNQLGIKCINEPAHFFDTLTFDCLQSGFSSADFVISEFHKYDINLRKISDNLVSVSLNETTTIDDLASLIEIFAHLKE
jgi:glycine dehydrogenase